MAAAGARNAALYDNPPYLMTHTTNSPSREEGWEADFDEWYDLYYHKSPAENAARKIQLKKVIAQYLSSQRDTLVEGLRKMKWDDDGQVANYDERNRVAFYTHNSAIDAAIKLIKETL